MSVVPIIQVRDLNLIYNLGKSNEFHAMHGISVDIYPQEYIILFGPSGCGKSTLLYSIFGVLPPTSGLVSVKGENIYAYTPKQTVKYQSNVIGIIYQAFYLIPSLTVQENVALPQTFGGISPGKREENSKQLLKRFGVDKQASKLPTNLSGGQQQRVAVARSLVGDPEILLADEPVGNLDSISAEQVMGMLDDINKNEKRTVILVTHDAKYLPYAHRVFYMRDGRLERIVVNPEKKQIAETGERTVVTEIEKLARIHPYLSPEELRVKSIVNYLTQEMSFEQIELLEKGVNMIIDGKVDEEGFFRMLKSPVEEGGAGISYQKAKSMAEKTRKILEESRDIRRYRREAQEEPENENKRLIRRLRQHLMDVYDGEISIVQVHRMEEAIAERILGTINKDDFAMRLGLSLDQGGMGFKARSARELSIYLEKLLAQGVQGGVSGKGD